MDFKDVSFDELFVFPSINTGITEEFIFNNKGVIPVYGSRKDGKPIGYVSDNLNLKYFENCISWNRNGSVGYTFYRDHKFVTTDDHRPLWIKEKYINLLDVHYARFVIQNIIFANGFAWDNKAGVDKIKLLYLPIPIKEDGGFDIETQKKLSQRYERIDKFQKNIKDYIKIIKNCIIKIDISQDIKYRNIDLINYFEFYKGNAKYTNKYFLAVNGDYPVYSGATKNFGIVAHIDTYDWNTEGEQWLTWTTDGVYAGTVFIRVGKFSMNTHCGLIRPRNNIDKNIDIQYVAWVLNQVLPNYAYGDQNKRVTKGIIENISIKIPIKDDGNFDLGRQKLISEIYQNAENKRKSAIDALNRVVEVQVKI